MFHINAEMGSTTKNEEKLKFMSTMDTPLYSLRPLQSAAYIFSRVPIEITERVVENGRLTHTSPSKDYVLLYHLGRGPLLKIGERMCSRNQVELYFNLLTKMIAVKWVGNKLLFTNSRMERSLLI